jgi:predicted TIM-barrel fold metal-dependent hydrolase
MQIDSHQPFWIYDAARDSWITDEMRVQADESEDEQPYLGVAFDAFEADRLMFGSDWPACRLAVV